MSYQGHLSNGNPVQQHSAGDCYPFVIIQKGLAPNAHYGIMYGSKVYEVADSFNGTVEAAMNIKLGVAPVQYEEALQERAELYAELCTQAEAEPDVEIRLDDFDGEEPTVRDIVYQYIEAGAFLEEEIGERMLKLSVHDNGMFLKDFRDDRFIFEIYPSLNTAGVVAQIMWRLQPNEYVCNFAEWRGVVAAWLLHCGESVMNWQSLAFDTWQSAAYHEVKSWQDLCALLNAVTSKD